jgi:alpha-1,2-glucosyltransferase
MLTLLPTHFFFTFLYYTDVGSTLFVLAAYSLALPSETGRRYPTLAAICAAVAVLFRQTNIIWAVFIAGDMVLRDRDFNVKPHPSITDGFSFVGKVLSKVTILLQRYFAFISVGIIFAAFVFLNGEYGHL